MDQADFKRRALTLLSQHAIAWEETPLGREFHLRTPVGKIRLHLMHRSVVVPVAPFGREQRAIWMPDIDGIDLIYNLFGGEVSLALLRAAFAQSEPALHAVA